MRAFLILLFAMLGPSFAAAQTKLRTIVAAAGVEVRITHHTWFNVEQCRSLGLPQLANIRTTAGGRVWVKPENLPLRSSLSEKGQHCVGREMQSAAVYYQAKQGFQGVETVTYQVVYPASCKNCRNYEVTVDMKISGSNSPHSGSTEPVSPTR